MWVCKHFLLEVTVTAVMVSNNSHMISRRALVIIVQTYKYTRSMHIREAQLQCFKFR